jgi:outer membrane biosynthesis protein TonB
MADSGQIAQATALKISVTVQGSKTVEGTDQRELFTETTKTILISEHGAVLKLDARISPGQCVFLRNDQSGREILCKVLESRQAGEAGYTDLEFTVSEPKFWDVPAEQPPLPMQKLEVPKGIEVAVVSPAAIPIMESGEPAPTSEEIPAIFPQTANAAPSSVSPESTEAPPKLPNRADGTEAKDAVPDWDEEKDAQLMAVLAAMDGKSKPQRTAPKETKDSVQQAAAANGQQESKAGSNAASAASATSSSASAIRNMREWGARQNPIYVRIAAAVLLAAALGVAWHAKSGSSTHKSNPPPAVSAQPAPQSQHVAAPPSQTLAAAAAAAVNNVPPPQAQQGQKIQSSTETAKPDDSAAQSSAPTALDPDPAPTAEERAVHRTAEGPSEAKTIPAKIVSQTQPSLPPWATGLDVDPVVQLEVWIDEKGNVVETKPVSGPRLLQASAQRAVGLWIFEPALSDGKPIATHMVLTVEFQKIPEGTN